MSNNKNLKALDSWVVSQTSSPFCKNIFFDKEKAEAYFDHCGQSDFKISLVLIELGYYSYIVSDQTPFISFDFSGLECVGSMSGDCRRSTTKIFYTNQENMLAVKDIFEKEKLKMRRWIDDYYSRPWV